MDDLEKMVFTKGPEVQPEDLKQGEWYVIDSDGYGFPPSLAGMAQTVKPKLRLFGPEKSWYLDLPQLVPSARNYSFEGCRFKMFRANEQPKLTRAHLMKRLCELGLDFWPTTGTDPEIFVEDAAGNVIPAYEFLPSRKDVGTSGMYWDGFQAEFNTTPASCQDTHGGFLHDKLIKLKTKLPKGSKFSTKSVIDIPAGLMKSAAPEYVDFGCRESLNAYGLVGEKIPNPRELPIRFAGGHIHWGISEQSRPSDFEARAQDAVKFVDAVAGLIGVSLAEGLDDPRRRRYYGLAGEYRLPPHGIEYRTLSNFWLLHPSVYHLVFTLGRLALKLGLTGHRSGLVTLPEIAVVNAINQTDPKFARELLCQQRDLIEAMIRTSFGDTNVTETFEKLLSPILAWGVKPERMLDYWRNRDCGYVMRWSWFISHKDALNVEPTKSTTEQPTALPDVQVGPVAVQPPQPTRR